MDKEKGEPVVVIKEEESKETKEMAPSERAKSITSSHSKSEPKKEEKKDVLSFDKIKVYTVEMVVMFTLISRDRIDKYLLFNFVLIAGGKGERATATEGA